MGLAPLTAALADAMQQTNLRSDIIGFRLPAAGIFQPVGHVVISQFSFGFDGGGEEFDIFFNGTVSRDGHAAGQYRTHFMGTQGAEIVGKLARQHRDVEARQVVGERTHFGHFVQLAAFDNPCGRVGDGDGQMHFAIRCLFGIQRIVHILGAGAVDGDKVQRCQIATLKTFVLHFGRDAIRRFFFEVVARQRHPPWDEMVVAKGDELGQLGVETAIAF